MAVADWFAIGVPLLAGVCCALAAWQRRGRTGLAFGLLGFSGVAWAAVGAATALAGQSAIPFPTFDLRFLAAVLPAIVALALLPSPVPLAQDRTRIVLDGGIVGTSLLFVSWGTGLGVAYQYASGDLGARLSALAHPFGNLVLAVMVTFVVYGAVRTMRLPRILLGVGLLYAVISDSAGTWLQFQSGSSLFSSVLAWSWTVGFAVIGAAALIEWRQAAAVAPPRPNYAAAVAVLYLPLVGAVGLAVRRQLDGAAPDPFLFWDGLVVLAMVVAREVLTFRTNRTLHRTFDDRLTALTSELRLTEQRFHTIVDHAPEAMMLIDDQGIVRFESQSVERVLGRQAGSSRDQSWLSLVHPEDQPRLESLLEKSRRALGVPISFELRVSHGDDGWRHAEATLTNLLAEAAVGGFIVTIRDTTDQKALAEQLERHALYDRLTGLANRALFRDRLSRGVIRAARRPEQPAVLLMDVDGLKQIGETLGNQAVDDVLIAVADRLRECVRSADTVARFGSDSFAILLEDSQTREAPAQVAERILTELARLKIGEASTPLTAGIGIATLTPPANNPDDLLRNADTALAEAKAAGHGKIALFDSSVSHAVAAQLELEADLQRAIERREFAIHYQPIIRLKDGRPSAVEALVRWVHPWRGLLMPADFILVADKTGAIVSLGRWLTLEAARQVRRWQEQLQLPTLGLAVNLSVRQLEDEGLPNDIRKVLSETGLEPGLLMLEVQEPTILADLQRSIAVLGKLKDLGVNLAIDDCRSGPTTLGYVRHVPVDTIKIDRSFVMNLGKSRERSQVEGMISTGNWLKVAMIAEGIEEASQASDLDQMGCELGQGFHFSKPLAAGHMFDYLDKQCRPTRAA